MPYTGSFGTLPPLPGALPNLNSNQAQESAKDCHRIAKLHRSCVRNDSKWSLPLINSPGLQASSGQQQWPFR